MAADSNSTRREDGLARFDGLPRHSKRIRCGADWQVREAVENPLTFPPGLRKGKTVGEFSGKHTSGAKARVDSADLMPGINPWPTTRAVFPQPVKPALIPLPFAGDKSPAYRPNEFLRGL
jgi:hypothetical protein